MHSWTVLDDLWMNPQVFHFFPSFQLIIQVVNLKFQKHMKEIFSPTSGPHPVIYKYDFESSGYRAAPSNQAVFNLFIEAIQLIAEEASKDVVVELQLPSNSSRIAGWSDMEKSYDFVTARLRVKEPHGSYSKAMLLTAHFDSVIPQGVADEDLNSMGVGMSDDAVGCAAVLETFRALATAAEAPMVDIILLLANGEEHGT